MVLTMQKAEMLYRIARQNGSPVSYEWYID